METKNKNSGLGYQDELMKNLLFYLILIYILPVWVSNIGVLYC